MTWLVMREVYDETSVYCSAADEQTANSIVEYLNSVSDNYHYFYSEDVISLPLDDVKAQAGWKASCWMSLQGINRYCQFSEVCPPENDVKVVNCNELHIIVTAKSKKDSSNELNRLVELAKTKFMVISDINEICQSLKEELSAQAK